MLWRGLRKRWRVVRMPWQTFLLRRPRVAGPGVAALRMLAVPKGLGAHLRESLLREHGLGRDVLKRPGSLPLQAESREVHPEANRAGASQEARKIIAMKRTRPKSPLIFCAPCI